MADSTPVAFFARHGATTLNDSNMFRGTMDPTLNNHGREDANVLAKYLAPIELSVIFYSDRKRSTETADIIGRSKPGVDKFGTPNLYAWNVGMFSGQPKSPENVNQLRYYIENPNTPIPEGESLNEFKYRIRPCLQEAVQIADQMGAPTLCIVHSSVIHEVGEFFNQDHLSTLVKPGGVCMVSYDLGTGLLKAEPIFKPELGKETDPSHIS